MILKLDDDLASLLEQVLGNRAGMHDVLKKLPGGKYGLDVDKEYVINLMSDDFAISGLGAGDEPNQRGLMLEQIIDLINKSL